jgi:Rrf2 family transcriptional regulator, nitric oxide-sensitive transcriptional repressor
MQLTYFTDYALRTLLYLATQGERLIPIAEISAAYGISSHHLGKVANLLAREGLVEAVRGRGGGLRLARPAGQIKVGAVVRACEPNMHLVECFDKPRNTCPIAPVCGLARALAQAQEQFLASLDGHTLAELAAPGARTDRLLQIWRRTAAAG